MMIALVFTSVFLGFYILYQSSHRTAVKKSVMDLWMHKHVKFARISGLIFIVIGVIAGAFHFGTTISVFYTLVLLMTVSSLTIMLYPLCFPKHKK